MYVHEVDVPQLQKLFLRSCFVENTSIDHRNNYIILYEVNCHNVITVWFATVPVSTQHTVRYATLLPYIMWIGSDGQGPEYSQDTIDLEKDDEHVSNGTHGNGSKDIGNTGQGEGEAPPRKKAKREQTTTGSCVCVCFLCLCLVFMRNHHRDATSWDSSVQLFYTVIKRPLTFSLSFFHVQSKVPV